MFLNILTNAETSGIGNNFYLIAVRIEMGQNVKWIKLNQGQFGYFRVNYPDYMWKNLRSVALTEFSAKERCGLIDDAFSLAYANYMDYNVAMEYSQVMRNETEYVPWDCSDGHFLKIGHLLSTSLPEAYSIYRASTNTQL